VRFYDPSAGRIMIDGVDVRQMPLRTLRENITLLHQESQLFGGSIYDNIAYGRPRATPEDVGPGRPDGDAHEFVAALPEDTTRMSANRGGCSPAASASGSPSPAPCLEHGHPGARDEPTTAWTAMSAMRIMEPLRRLIRPHHHPDTHDTSFASPPTRSSP